MCKQVICVVLEFNINLVIVMVAAEREGQRHIKVASAL